MLNANANDCYHFNICKWDKYHLKGVRHEILTINQKHFSIVSKQPLITKQAPPMNDWLNEQTTFQNNTPYFEEMTLNAQHAEIAPNMSTSIFFPVTVSNYDINIDLGNHSRNKTKDTQKYHIPTSN